MHREKGLRQLFTFLAGSFTGMLLVMRQVYRIPGSKEKMHPFMIQTSKKFSLLAVQSSFWHMLCWHH